MLCHRTTEHCCTISASAKDTLSQKASLPISPRAQPLATPKLLSLSVPFLGVSCTWNHAIGAFVSAPLFSKGTRFLLCLLDTEFPLFDIEMPGAYRSDVIREATLGIMGTILGPRPLFLLGHLSLTPDRTGLVPPVAHTETREMQKAGRHTPKGNALLTTQGQRKVSADSGPNHAPSHWVPQGETTRMQVQVGTGTGGVREAELPGKDSGKTKNSMEAALVTLRPAGVWSGDQQPWGEREEEEVPWRKG